MMELAFTSLSKAGGLGWDLWVELFAPLPYGDPYVAGLVAFFASVVILKLVVAK